MSIHAYMSTCGLLLLNIRNAEVCPSWSIVTVRIPIRKNIPIHVHRCMDTVTHPHTDTFMIYSSDLLVWVVDCFVSMYTYAQVNVPIRFIVYKHPELSILKVQETLVDLQVRNNRCGEKSQNLKLCGSLCYYPTSWVVILT